MTSKRGNEKKSVEEVIEKLATDNLVKCVDDLTANQIYSAIHAVALDSGSDNELVEMGLDQFLRSIVRRIFDDNKIKGRINIGPNRHFPSFFSGSANTPAAPSGRMGLG